MIDLTNKNIDLLVQKYTPVLELIVGHKQQLPYLVVVFEIAVTHIKEKHNELTVDWKAWAVFVIKKLFLNKKITNEREVTETIDEFILYWKENYKSYCDNLAMFASEYDRDRGFVYGYLSKKNR
jgi:hypothetical protein